MTSLLSSAPALETCSERTIQSEKEPGTQAAASADIYFQSEEASGFILLFLALAIRILHAGKSFT